jgi:DNA-binding transcriptional regulator YdaS (Cro superfamily)
MTVEELQAAAKKFGSMRSLATQAGVSESSLRHFVSGKRTLGEGAAASIRAAVQGESDGTPPEPDPDDVVLHRLRMGESIRGIAKTTGVPMSTVFDLKRRTCGSHP